MNRAKRLILIAIVLSSCVGCDQATKAIAKALLPGVGPLTYLGDTVRLQLAHNTGAFLSLGATLPEPVRQGIFSVGVAVLLLGVLAYAILAKRGRWPFVVALSLILAGGVSNLVDRVAYGGYVVDFINLGIGPVRTGIFNIADVAIMTGAIALVALSFLARSSEGELGVSGLKG